MAVESKRGCGYRQVGGLYLMGVFDQAKPCDRLPFPLTVCPTCGQGMMWSRAWKTVKPVELFEGDHFVRSFKVLVEIKKLCPENTCPVCRPALMTGNMAGMMWVGEKNYSPESFRKEALEMGVSKRVPSIPKDVSKAFKEQGGIWVLAAHKKVIPHTDEEGKETMLPAIFMAWWCKGVDYICKKSEHDRLRQEKELLGLAMHDDVKLADLSEGSAKLQRLLDRGVNLVPVPDDDPDHNPEINGKKDTKTINMFEDREEDADAQSE